MKISNSKKQLAQIIHENGGWRDGAEFAAQGGNHGHVGFASVATVRNGKVWDMTRGFAGKFLADEILPNWHQTILSRDEYFYLYPVAETAPEPVKVVVENKTACHLTVTDKPTIEQLAADYRNLKDFAERKQQEADAAKADADAKLAELVATGKALGLVLSVAGVEPGLVITDWRDLQVEDEVALTAPNGGGVNVGEVGVIRRIDGSSMSVNFPSQTGHLISRSIANWMFIRRPSKGEANA